jgi:serine phosphatase RsbU (regulator of sigma subunit)
MGRLRSTLRGYALEFPGPAEVLRKLDYEMQYFEQDEAMATVSYAVLYPDSGQLAISSAGHFPPVIAAPGQRGSLARIAVDPPIGVTDDRARQATTLTLAPGSVLCLFTDGLVERRDEPIDDGIARLCRAVTPSPPENVCTLVMHALIGRDHPRDDTALLALRWWARGSCGGSGRPGQGFLQTGEAVDHGVAAGQGEHPGDVAVGPDDQSQFPSLRRYAPTCPQNGVKPC